MADPLTAAQIKQYASNAGFTGEPLNKITAISLAESSGNPNAYNPNDPHGGSYGITQINGVHPGAAAAYGNPQVAMDLAYSVSKGGTDFSPWSTYNNGAYSQYLSSAQSANVGSGSPNMDITAPDSFSPGSLTNGSVPGGSVDPTTGMPIDANGMPTARTDANGNPISASGSAGTWWNWAEGRLLDFLSRFGLIVLGIVLIGGAAIVMSRKQVAEVAGSFVRGAA